ncbi:hypothetical protein BGZ96_006718 [Linnemannia gamsii]|uniref:Uncharacterized protein n=1 Tax=Linnemannia gamsii TaxID=64522 RepID=A0ABQ7K372_9FUNG|nr:hypothetical protein BGZ96_006718 [Linnemannia gamsii]
MTPQELSYVEVVCPKIRPKITPIMFVGTGGLCIGARLGGNLKLGGGRINDQHRQSCPVLMTNEMRTSQVDIWRKKASAAFRAQIDSQDRDPNPKHQ